TDSPTEASLLRDQRTDAWQPRGVSYCCANSAEDYCGAGCVIIKKPIDKHVPCRKSIPSTSTEEAPSRADRHKMQFKPNGAVQRGCSAASGMTWRTNAGGERIGGYRVRPDLACHGASC